MLCFGDSFPQHIAVANGNENCVAILLANGADPNIIGNLRIVCILLLEYTLNYDVLSCFVPENSLREFG